MNRIRRIFGHPVVRVGYFLFLIAAAVYYLYRWGDQLPELVARVEPFWVVAALGTTLVAGMLYTSIQFAIFRHLGADVSYRTTFRIISIAQLGKYLPGKVMFAGNYYLLSRAAGISNVQVLTSFVISQALWLLTASLCGLPVLSLLHPALRYTIVLLPLAVALLIHPRFLEWLLRMGQRIAGQAQGQPLPLPEGLGVRFYVGVALLYMMNWGLAGLAAWFCLRAFGPQSLELLPLVLASIALGTAAGFVALFAPVGFGVREGLGALILAPAVGAEVALLALMLLRFITVIGDLSLAVVGMLLRASEPDSP